MDVSDGNAQGINPGFLENARARLESVTSPPPLRMSQPLGKCPNLRLDRNEAGVGHRHHFLDQEPVFFSAPRVVVLHHDRVEAGAHALLNLGQVVGLVQQKSEGRLELARTAAAKQP